ncbi:MAG TPA: OmpA family protein [Stellaceae bacterium]|nr:OmpA family protein [Stellaceae bacterium]
MTKALDFRVDSIVMSVTITNPGDAEIWLNHGRSLVLADDRQGTHHLNPPPDNPDLRIPPHTQLDGDLVFVGPLGAAAHQLTLADGAVRTTLPLTAPAGPAHPVYQADIADGIALQVRRIRASGSICIVSLLATNGSARTIVLNQKPGLLLADARGLSTPVTAPADNRELVVPAGNRLDAELLADCRSLDTATRLTLSTAPNAAAGPDDGVPAFTLKAAAAERSEAPAPAASRATVAPIAWSRLSEPMAIGDAAPPTAAEAPPQAATPGKAEQLAQALHARKTERGLRLQLSADALFAATASTPGPESGRLLGQLANLIAATKMQEVIVTVHAGTANPAAENDALSRQRAQAIAAWLEQRASEPRPRFVAKGVRWARPDIGSEKQSDPAGGSPRRGDAWIDVILRRDYLVPNKRSPASPSPGKI